MEILPDEFTLEVKKTEDGWIVISPDIPGLCLAHKHLHKVFLPLEIVATKLIEYNGPKK